MSIRVDTSPLIAGSVVVGDPGLGVVAENIPSDGDSGAGYAYASLSLPADAGKEICGRITSWPTLGTLKADEDTSFVFDGPDGGHAFTWQLYVDGVATGSPQTATLVLGEQATSHTLTVASSTQAQTSPAVAAVQTTTMGRPASDVSAGSWTSSTGGTLSSTIDEVTASDTDYITATSTEPCTLALSPVATPAAGTNKVVRYRAWSPTGGVLLVELTQGTTLITSWARELTSTPLNYMEMVPADKAALITDYSALRVHLTNYSAEQAAAMGDLQILINETMAQGAYW